MERCVILGSFLGTQKETFHIIEKNQENIDAVGYSSLIFPLTADNKAEYPSIILTQFGASETT